MQNIVSIYSFHCPLWYLQTFLTSYKYVRLRGNMSIGGSGVSFDTIYTSDQQFGLMIVY
jgi:hypothetical protein